MAMQVDHAPNPTKGRFSGGFCPQQCGARMVCLNVLRQNNSPSELKALNILMAQFERYKVMVASVDVGCDGEASSTL
jgi:hypothetical protein